MFLMPGTKWARLLAYVTGLVHQKLLLQNEYLAAENRILRAHLPVRCASPIPRDRPQLKSVSDSAGRRLTKLPVSPSPPSRQMSRRPRVCARLQHE